MIVCLIPPELEAALYEKMVRYYQDTPGVTVVVTAQATQDRRHDKRPTEADRRVLRDRLHRHTTGTDAGPV